MKKNIAVKEVFGELAKAAIEMPKAEGTVILDDKQYNKCDISKEALALLDEIIPVEKNIVEIRKKIIELDKERLRLEGVDAYLCDKIRKLLPKVSAPK